MKHYRFKVTGKVQGVFFRNSTQEKATEIGLKGTVKNLEDGSVEVYAQGPEERLRNLEQWLRKGPPAARVDHLYKEEVALGDYDDFQVIR